MFLKSIYSGIIFDVEEMPPFLKMGGKYQQKKHTTNSKKND